MYRFVKCSEALDLHIFRAFTDGFIDYIIQAKMDQETFINHFFGLEGNNRELSYIAYRDDQPVGVILGGTKKGEEYKTLRCGAMAVIPEERGTGLAKSLMDLHITSAKELGCRQLFLEVIDCNDRAIHFYQKMGYDKVYNLTYRSWILEELNSLKVSKNDMSDRVQVMQYDDICSLRNQEYSHLPWQGDFPYFKELPCHYYGIKDKDEIMAGIVATHKKIYYLWVHPNKRQRGYAKALLSKVIQDLEPTVLHITYANNAKVHTFANYLGMEKDKINQLEMYKWLD